MIRSIRRLFFILVALPAFAVAKGKDDRPPPVARPPVVTGKQHTRTPSCPQGYYFQEGKCVSKQEVPEAHSCPGGTTERAGQCLQFSPARYTCPGGLTLSGEECIGTTAVEKMHQCPSGSQQIGKECIIHISKIPVCPAGTAAVGDRCARLVPMVKSCPTGYTSRGDLCATQEYEQLLTVCPSGTYQEGEICKTVTQEIEECPEGTHDAGARCATYTGKISECPKGYSKAGSTCIRTESAQKTAICPNGADPNNNCLVKVPVPPSPVCKVGKLINSQCHKPRRIPPVYTCPEGYTLSRGSTCVKTVPYDCSQTHHDIECEQVPTGKGSNVRHRMLGVDAKGKYQSVGYSKRHAAPLPVCHKVPRTTPKTCEKQITAQAEAVCQEGVFKGTYCEIDEYFAPDYRCDAESDGKGSCYVEERTAIIRACPPGFSNTGSSCMRTESVPPLYYCPPGTEEPSCATYVPKRCPRGDCSHQHIEPPQYICPDGYHMLESAKHGGYGGMQGQCTKTIYADKVPQCPSGTTHVEGMVCASYVDKVASSHDKRVPMQHVCPQDYAEDKSRCTLRVVKPAVPVCSQDAILEAGNCLTSVPQNSGCPKGATAEKGKCWAYSTVDPIMVDTVVQGTGKGY